MRSAQRFAATFAVSLLAGTILTTVAEAQNRREPLRVTVQKRSYFDAGKVVPVGSMNRYASQHGSAAPVYASTASFYGEETLPARSGTGRNPFADVYATPRY